MRDVDAAPRGVLGWLGFGLGAGALLLAFVILWAGPFAPQQSAGAGLGELASEIAKSAARSVAGLPQPAPTPPPRDIDDLLGVAVALASGLAIILGIAALVRREPKRVAFAGIALGGMTVAFQLFAWTVMLIVGGLVLAALIYALRDAFGDMFDGLFGG